MNELELTTYLSDGLDAIRDSRIAISGMAFGTLRDHVRHQRFAAGAFPRRLPAWRERNNLSQSEAALKLQLSKRALQEWEQGRAASHGFARSAIEKAIHGWRAHMGLLANVTIRESCIASR